MRPHRLSKSLHCWGEPTCSPAPKEKRSSLRDHKGNRGDRHGRPNRGADRPAMLVMDEATPATSAPGLGSPLPHVHRDWARREYDWTRTAVSWTPTCLRSAALSGFSPLRAAAQQAAQARRHANRILLYVMVHIVRVARMATGGRRQRPRESESDPAPDCCRDCSTPASFDWAHPIRAEAAHRDKL